MKILVDVLHPAHVHFFRYAIREWQAHGHQVLVTARDKDLTLQLLTAYDIEYTKISDYGRGLWGLGWELLCRNLKLFTIARRFRPDILLGISGVSISPVGRLLGRPAIMFTDTEYATWSNAISVPFASRVCTPTCFKKDFGRKHVRYNGYHELAYLHPNFFTPQARILQELGIRADEPYFVLRFVSWQAAHDIGEGGIAPAARQEVISTLSQYGRVFISSEAPLAQKWQKYQLKLAPEKIHHLLAYASLYLGESPTMATESAILGTPAILVSSWASGLGNMQELAQKYGLMFCFTDEKQAEAKALKLVCQPGVKQHWQKKAKILGQEKIEVTPWLVKLVEDYPDSVSLRALTFKG